MPQLLAVIFSLAFVGTMITGWVFNIINLFNGVYEELGHIVLSAIGIFFAPIGIFMGYFF